MKMLLFHAVFHGIIRMKGCFFLMFAAVRQEQSIYRDRLGVYQRHGDSIAEPGDDSAAKLLGKSDPKNPQENLGFVEEFLNRWSSRRQLYARNLSFLGVHFGLEYNCTVFVSKPCVYLSPWVMDACWFSSACRFGTVRHWTKKTGDFRNWFYHPSNIPCQWYHPSIKPLVRLIPSNDASLMIQWFYPPSNSFPLQIWRAFQHTLREVYDLNLQREGPLRIERSREKMKQKWTHYKPTRGCFCYKPIRVPSTTILWESGGRHPHGVKCGWCILCIIGSAIYTLCFFGSVHS